MIDAIKDGVPRIPADVDLWMKQNRRQQLNDIEKCIILAQNNVQIEI